MFDPRDNLDEAYGKYGSGRSALRPRQARGMYRRQMIDFAKMFIVRYLNTDMSVEEIVDDWLATTAFVTQD